MKSVTRMLLEEDDRSIANFVEPELERLDFSVGCAHDGVSGLEEVKRFGPELVVLDIMLPKPDGVGVLKDLRRQNCQSSCSPPATSRWIRSTASTSARTTT
jgi:DNA-binding response OmpR family regulator